MFLPFRRCCSVPDRFCGFQVGGEAQQKTDLGCAQLVEREEAATLEIDGHGLLPPAGTASAVILNGALP